MPTAVLLSSGLLSLQSSVLPSKAKRQDRTGWTLHHYAAASESDDDFNNFVLVNGTESESLSKMIDLDGRIVFGSGKCSVNIDRDCFLPRDALNDERPDTSDESGYTGNVSLNIQ